jgi:hypothetical protein
MEFIEFLLEVAAEFLSDGLITKPDPPLELNDL